MKLKHRCPVFHHILFVDETVLFGKMLVDKMMKFKGVQELYCLLLGQAVNEAKSAILFSKNMP
ncbi:hypothetical protein LINPERHAP2_LOCUS15784 [Linum perenne]